MSIMGVVRDWSDEQGWGVVDSDEPPGGCRAHFSDIRQSGYRSLRAGQRVHLDWEAGEQDGYAFRATALWPEGSERADPSPSGSAYGSALTVTFTDPATGETTEHHAAGNDPEAMDRLFALMRRSGDGSCQHGRTTSEAQPPGQ